MLVCTEGWDWLIIGLIKQPDERSPPKIQVLKAAGRVTFVKFTCFGLHLFSVFCKVIELETANYSHFFIFPKLNAIIIWTCKWWYMHNMTLAGDQNFLLLSRPLHNWKKIMKSMSYECGVGGQVFQFKKSLGLSGSKESNSHLNSWHHFDVPKFLKHYSEIRQNSSNIGMKF
jgi:hypothetical protein